LTGQNKTNNKLSNTGKEFSMSKVWMAVLAAVVLTPGSISAETGSAISTVDTLWVLVAAFLVFFMNAGFAFIETGFCRAKNAVNILTKNYVVFAISALVFWGLGYGLMFGEQGNTFIGAGSFLVSENSSSPVSNIPLFAFFFFQLAFASAACSIISGAVAERIKFAAFILFGIVMVGVIYPIGGHWVWGGGWLADLGFHDFAGSTVVHSAGGWAALAGIILLGARLGKYRKDGSARAIVGHSIPLATLGGFILWLGWFGFNPGSELAVTENVPRIALTTALASCAGTITAMFTAWKLMGKPDLSMIINGCLAGLVAITAGCAVISPLGSVIVGAIGGILVVVSVIAFDKVKIDDPVGALSVHLVNGVWGTLAVGLFAVPGRVDGVTGLFYGGGIGQVLSQLAGITAIGGIVFILSMVFWFIIKKTIGLRVSREEEIGGLDIGEMGLEAYNGFQIFTTEG
jgi:Amt family ammonium transporter